MKLHSIATEAKNCRKAFKGFEHRGFTLHCHHELLGEPLTKPAKRRIAYILSDKPEHEQALRLRLFRPITESQLKSCKGYAEWRKTDAEWHKACAEYNKANAKYNKACSEHYKANAKWGKTNAEYNKASAEYNKACAEYDKAHAEYNKACAEWDKACTEYDKAYTEFSKEVHDTFCDKDCPWNGMTIFPASTGGTPR